MKEKIQYEMIRPLVLKVKNIIGISIETPNDDTFVLKRGKKEVGKITYNFETTEIEVEGQEFQLILKDMLRKDKENKEFFTESVLKKTTMPDLLKDISLYNGLHLNKEVFRGVNDIFKGLKISKVYVNKPIDKRTEILKSLSLFINPDIQVSYNPNDGFRQRAAKVLFKTYPHTLPTEDKMLSCVGNGRTITPIGTEVIEPIILHDYEIGKYYKDRNLILIFFNPFMINNIGYDQTETSQIILDLVEELNRLEVTKQNTDTIIRQNFITNFMSSVTTTLREKQGSLTHIVEEIKSYESTLIQKMRDKALTLSNIEHLKTLIDTDGHGILKDLYKLDKLPFLEKYVLNNDSLDLVYKPTFITIKDFKRNPSTKSVGLRKIYLGQLIISITPTGIHIKSDYPMEKRNPHTHASDGGYPCFGDGDAAAKIRSFRTENKFGELASMLWFWIQTHREGGAYLKMSYLYDDRLSKGLPVLDETGKLISINDPDKIKSGEQIKLEKHDTYDKNITNIKTFMEANK